MTQSLLLGLANNIWLLSAVIVAVVISFYSLKSIQLLSDTKQDFCRRTLKLFKALGLLQFFAAALLVSRLSISTTVSMTDPSSLIGGTWCLIRVSAAILCSLCILISHAHFIFRWLAFLLQPAIAASDLISELYFVSAANCIRRGLCVYNESMLIWNSAFAVRDLICASLQIAGFIICASLIVHLGFISTLPLPIVEQREFTKPHKLPFSH